MFYFSYLLCLLWSVCSCLNVSNKSLRVIVLFVCFLFLVRQVCCVPGNSRHQIDIWRITKWFTSNEVDAHSDSLSIYMIICSFLESVWDLDLMQVIHLKCASQENTVRERMKQERDREKPRHQHCLRWSLTWAWLQREGSENKMEWELTHLEAWHLAICTSV